jgi:hypothetical protein
MFKTMIRMAATTIGATGLVLAGVGVAGVGVASAAPAIVHPDALHSQSDGTAGIEANKGISAKSIGATVIAAPAFQNIGAVGKGGGGTQLCDPNNGFGLQLGLTATGPSTDTVEYAAGTLAGAAKNVCEGNGVLDNPHVLNANLSGISQGDTIQLYTHFFNTKVKSCHWVGPKGHAHRVCNHVWQGRATFQAYDATTGEGVYTAYVHTAADWNLGSVGAGIQQDTTGLSACTPLVTAAFSPNQSTTSSAETGAGYFPPAEPLGIGSGACNLVIAFSKVIVDGPGIFETFGAGLTATGAWNEITTTGGGLPQNAVVVGTNGTLFPMSGFGASSLDVFAGQVLG